ncbi:MAG: hypothetical protein ACI9JN_001991 [Bacteroidia bacterium]|jgi:hypothetical protein
MRKQILLTALVLWTFQLSAQKNAIEHKSSSYDLTMQKWELKAVTNISYFNNNDSVSYLVSNVDINGDKFEARRYITTYNSDGNILSNLSQNGNSVAGFSNFVKQTYDYSAITIDGETKTYLATYVHYRWNSGVSMWDTGNYEYSTVDNIQGKINETIKVLSPNNRNRTLYTYNTKGELSTEEFQYSSGVNWVKSIKTFYTHTSNGLTEVEFLYDKSADSFNVKRRKYISTFDNDGRLLERVHTNWMSNRNNYVLTYREKYTYDNDGDITEEVTANYSQLNSNWVLSGKTEYIYKNQSGVLSQEILGVRVYPNPTTDVINIDLQEVKRVSIYSVSGLWIKSLNSSGMDAQTVQFYCGDLVDGMYILDILGEDNSSRRASIIVRH